MKIEEIVKTLNKAVDIKVGGGTPMIPPPLVLGSQSREGMSALKITKAVLAKKSELGLPTGNFEDGTANYDDIIIYEIVSQILKAIREDANIQVVIPAGTALTGTGGNTGGPVQIVGMTTAITTGGAIIQ
jgi:hypothetical protein